MFIYYLLLNEMFEEYLRTFHADELLEILKHSEKKQHYSLTIK